MPLCLSKCAILTAAKLAHKSGHMGSTTGVVHSGSDQYHSVDMFNWMFPTYQKKIFSRQFYLSIHIYHSFCVTIMLMYIWACKAIAGYYSRTKRQMPLKGGPQQLVLTYYHGVMWS